MPGGRHGVLLTAISVRNGLSIGWGIEGGTAEGKVGGGYHKTVSTYSTISPPPSPTQRNGPRKLDSALSEIFLRFQATNLTLA